MNRVLRPLTVVVAFALGSIAASAAPGLVYQTFDPMVIPVDSTGDVLYTVCVTGTPTRVVLVMNTPSGTATNLALRDDGTGGDLRRGDSVFTGTLRARDVAALLRPDDVFRAEVGFVEVYDGDTLAIRGNVFADILTVDIPILPVTSLAADAQRTDYVVNLVDRGFVLTNGFDIASVLRHFYDLFPDDFDFVNVVAVPGYFQNRFHFAAKSDVRGIGMTPFDTSRTYGSAGRLLGVTMFPNPIFFDLAEPGFQHELGHQWINFLPFAPLNYVLPHWPLSDLASGIMGFADSLSGQGLQFPCIVTPVPGGARLAQQFDPPVFTDLDLYLMGLLPASQVGPHVVFPRGTPSSDLFNACAGGTWSGTLETVTIADIVRQAGPRVPDAAHSPHSFRVATIIVSPDGLLSRDVMSFYSFFVRRAAVTEEVLCHIGFAKGMAKPFYLSTRGLGTLDARIVASP
jgi:hypothetical protein